MNIESLIESDLISFTHDYNNLYIEFKVLLNNNTHVKLLANNKNTDPISVEYTGLNINSNLTTSNNLPCLGEIESINTTNTSISFEGGFGFIKVNADTYSIE